jgi:hypothetical protein
MCKENCSCGGGGGSVVIQCGTAPSDTNGDDDPKVPRLPPTPPCQIVAVRFHSIRVRESNGVEIPLVGEQPERWELTLTANDQSLSIPIDAQDGADISIEQEVDVELPSPSTTISVRAGGTAKALVSFFDQPLPATENSHGASDNWGIDAQVQLNAGDSDRTYTVFYSIKCQIARTSSVISRKQAIDTIHEALSSALDSKNVPEDVALTLFIRRMESLGYRLKEIQSDLLVWEGRRNIHRTVRELLKRGSKTEPRK